jgi:hypothetical protein
MLIVHSPSKLGHFELNLDMMEISAVTGHRTPQMLKRYTHLRAEDLARKLDSSWNRAFKKAVHAHDCELGKMQFLCKVKDTQLLPYIML